MAEAQYKTFAEIAGKRPGGVECRKCGCTRWNVLNTYPVKQGIRRRRECANCGHQATTTERGG